MKKWEEWKRDGSLTTVGAVVALLIITLVVVVNYHKIKGIPPQVEQQVQVSEAPKIPFLGEHTILAYMDAGHKVVTLYRDAGIVCVENTPEKFGNPSSGTGAAFSCWDVDTAPKRIKELMIKRSKEQGSNDCGFGPCR